LDFISIKGPDEIYDDSIHAYNFTEISAAESYELLITEASDTNWIEGAETIDDLKIEAASISLDKLITNRFQREGSQSFHLVNSGENFQLSNEVIPSKESILKFDNFFRYVGEGTCLKVELKTENKPWQIIWQRYGKHGQSVIAGDWDENWTSTQLELKDYEGEKIKIRFNYTYEWGANWTPLPGEDPLEMGAFIDEIQVTDCVELIPLQSLPIKIDQKSFELNEIEPGEYWIQLRALISNNWFNYSYSKTIKRLTGSEPEVTIEKIKLSPDQIIKIEVTSKGIEELILDYSNDGGKTWNSFKSKNLSILQKQDITFEFPKSDSVKKLFRVRGSRETSQP
jgi:hypothetical protein